MTKTDLLNIASDLKRIAYWTAIGEKEKIILVTKLMTDINKKIKLGKYLDSHFDPQILSSSKQNRKLYAEELLMAGIKLQRLETRSYAKLLCNPGGSEDCA